jgi:hypothetical protein
MRLFKRTTRKRRNIPNAIFVKNNHENLLMQGFLFGHNGCHTLTDAERADKLEKGISLIKEVTFSYPLGSDERTQFCNILATNFMNRWFFNYWYTLKHKVTETEALK